MALTRRFSVMARLLLVALFVTAACTQATSPSGSSAPSDAQGGAPQLAAKQNISWALDFEPSGIDPHINQAVNAGRMITQIFDPLVYGTGDGKFVPGLAESWEISADGKTYTFKLRKDVKFHDGTPFNAAAVVFSFDRIRNPATKSQLAISLLGPVDSATAVDDSTVKVVFKTAYPAFLDSLSYPWLAPVSPTAVNKLGADFSRNLVGTGPFKLKEWVAKDHITLERNPDYNWAPSFFKHKGPAYLESVTYKFVPEWTTRSATLETGEIDIATDALAIDLPRLKANDKVKTISTQQAGVPQSYFINTEKPPLNDVNVRLALLNATDKQTIINTMHAGAYQPAFSTLSRSTTGYDKSYETNPKFAYNKDTARKLLDAAGWVPGPTGIRQKNGQPLQLTWLSQTINRDPQQGELLQGILKDVGIDVKVTTVPNFPNLSAGISAGNYNLVPSWWLGSDPSVLTATYHSKYLKTNNWSKSAIPALDQLLDQADAEPVVAKRITLYQDAQKIIIDQVLAVPVWDIAPIMAVRASLDGLTFDRRGVYLWLYDVYVKK